ncbi:MAG: phage-related protein [Hyphomicrobiaceae bacterium]
MIIIVDACRREIQRMPISIREDSPDALARLDEGHALAMPLSRPMPTIGSGVHELRLKDPPVRTEPSMRSEARVLST